MQAISFGNKPLYHEGTRRNRVNYQSPLENLSGLSQKEKKELMNAYYDKAVKMANMSDKDLLSIAKYDAHRNDKYKAGTYAATLAAVPVVDTFVNGITTNAPKLSGKLGVMGKTALTWGGVFALAGLYNTAIQKISAVSPAMQKFEDKHPIIKSLLSLAGFAGILIGGQKGIAKLAEVLPKRMPGVVADLAKARTSVANFINNSKLNAKILKPAKDKVVQWAVKHPKTSSIALSTLALSVPFMAMGALFKAFTDKSETAKQVKDNYAALVKVRNDSRKTVKMIDSAVAMQKLESLKKLESELKPVILGSNEAEQLDLDA